MNDIDIQPIFVIFDTRCILCSKWVRFLLKYETNSRLHFVGAWSPSGLALAARYGFCRQDLQKTYLVIADGIALTQSDASLALLDNMKAPWRWLKLSRIVPRRIRNAIYDLVARNRYQWFGIAETCIVPGPEMRDRFTLD